MVAFLNRVKMSVTGTPGTGTATLDAAVSPYQTVSAAGGVDGGKYKNLWEEGSAWEVSYGTYTASGTTMSRTLIESSTGSLLSLTSAATMTVVGDKSELGGSQALTEPQGRLTNSSGVPLLTSNVTGAGTIYYEPYKGNRGVFPEKDGFGLVMREFTSLSQALSDATKSPAAAGAWQCYDIWGWDDAGSLRATRGPGWTDGGRTFTVTIASPGVFTLNSHLFYEGQPVVLSTSGALPTGLSAATVYFLTATSLATNTFTLSATRGGAAINTSGSQSGTHTCTTYVQNRGTGSGTEEHDTTTYPGWRVNKYAITNGPAAGKGLYLGTILTNGSSQVDMYIGRTSASGGGANIIGIWNMYNAEELVSENWDAHANYSYTTSTWRAKNGNINNATVFVQGLNHRVAKFSSSTRSDNSSNTIWQTAAVLNNTTCTATNASSSIGMIATGGSNNSGRPQMIPYMSALVQGMNYFAPLEWGGGTGTTNWYGDNGGQPYSVTTTTIRG